MSHMATWESLAPGWSQPDSIAVFELTSESFFGWRYNMSSVQKRRFGMVYPMVNTDVFIIFQYTDGMCGFGWIAVL